MRIIHLYAENLLNLRAVSIEPNKRITRITGKNGAGKSNVLAAIFFALAGKKTHASEPIRTGQQKATVRIDLGEGDEVQLVVKLRITEKDSYLDVESPEGAVFRSPQAMLDALIGNLTFDPQEFARMPAAKRLETLRGLVKLDVNLDRLDELNAKDRTLRADWNRRVVSMRERLEMLSGLNLDADVTPIDIGALTDRMAKASDFNASRDAALNARRTAEQWIAQQRGIVAEKRAQAERLLVEAQGAEREAIDAQHDLDTLAPLPDRIDVTELRDEINAALATNAERVAMQRRIENYRATATDLDGARAMSKNLSDAMEARDAQKEAAIAGAKMPIAGLGFGNGDVTFEGHPFDQTSTGKQMRISGAIGMALNPKLRLLFVRNAPLLDSESYAVIEELAEEHDYQVLMEYTQDGPGAVGIHIVDGSVAFVDGKPVAGDDDEHGDGSVDGPTALEADELLGRPHYSEAPGNG